MMGGCIKCQKVGGILALLVGLAFLLQTYGVWNFWGLNWWTVLFLMWGVMGIGHSNCKDCQKMCK